MSFSKTATVIMALGTLGGLVLYWVKPRHQQATSENGEVTSNQSRFESRVVEVPRGTNVPPEKIPAAAAVSPHPAAKNSQQEAFNEFLEKMSQHSELLHEEFNILEQIRALHPNEGPSTNHLVFEKSRLAFEDLGRTASTNNDALQLLVDASKSQFLQGFAIAGIGVAAENGSQKAVDLLLEPKENGWLLSGSTGALVKIAQTGDARAIDFMYRLTTQQENKPLWSLIRDGLAPAAESGNEQAINGLINMSGFENKSVREQITQALKTATAKGNQNAANALKAIQDSQLP